jgi:hypothetical protein
MTVEQTRPTLLKFANGMEGLLRDLRNRVVVFECFFFSLIRLPG